MPSLCFDSESQTVAFGKQLADLAEVGDVIALSGSLGSGKTVLARGLIQAHTGESIDVTSPTFTLVHVYDDALPTIWHMDLYRLEDQSEIEELGLDEALATGITIVEWPEKAGQSLPHDRLDIKLSGAGNTNKRTAVITAGPSWTSRLKEVIARVP